MKFTKIPSINFLQNESGFALIVLPVVFVLFGFFITAVLSEAKPNNFYFEAETQDSMETVRKALAVYAHRNYRIPCPGAPEADAANLGVETATGGVGNECLRTVGVLSRPARRL